jgi:hypothetical protein
MLHTATPQSTYVPAYRAHPVDSSWCVWMLKGPAVHHSKFLSRSLQSTWLLPGTWSFDAKHPCSQIRQHLFLIYIWVYFQSIPYPSTTPALAVPKSTIFSFDIKEFLFKKKKKKKKILNLVDFWRFFNPISIPLQELIHYKVLRDITTELHVFRAGWRPQKKFC